MFRTIFTIGAFALLGFFALGIVFKIFAGLIGILGALISWAFWVLIIGAVIYFVIRLFSPETARRLREKFSGSNH